jgi:hypothetical protein
MASSHSGSFAKRWFLGRNKMKRMSARQETLFKEEESDTLYFKILGILEYLGQEERIYSRRGGKCAITSHIKAQNFSR